MSSSSSIGEAGEVSPTPRSSSDQPPIAATFAKGFLAAIVVGAVLYGSHSALSWFEQRKEAKA